MWIESDLKGCSSLEISVFFSAAILMSYDIWYLIQDSKVNFIYQRRVEYLAV